MSSFGAQMRKRFAELSAAGEDVKKIALEVAEEATLKAVETAVNNTPPNGTDIKGTGTRTGAMAQHWQTDSVTTPKRVGGVLETELNNNMQYASYVNDGHRMDMHYVPGLIINGNMLEKVDPSLGGIVVGTKTKYIRGRYMKEKAIGAYRETVRKRLEQRIKEVLK